MLKPNRFQPPLGPPKASPKQKVLAEWRHQDLSAEDKIQRPAKGMDTVLPKVLQDLRMDRRRAETEIIKVWNNLIDPTVTSHAQPTGINKGTLFVTVDSNAWLDEIVRFRRTEILKLLQHSFGRQVIARISFRVG